jgi:predicted SprT family Zn-dependent metalloprotease
VTILSPGLIATSHPYELAKVEFVSKCLSCGRDCLWTTRMFNVVNGKTVTDYECDHCDEQESS